MTPNSQLESNPTIISNGSYIDIENISHNEIETQQTNVNQTLDKLETWNNLTFLTGNTMAAVGNGLLYQNNILPAGSAACFIIDGAAGALTSLLRLLMYNLGYKNKTFDKILMCINLSQFSLLDAAVIQLNLPLPLNPKYQSVWGCFIPAASIATLNTSLATRSLYCNDEQQPSSWKKAYNTVVSILPNIGVNLALTGVINMSKIYLNDNHDDENKNNVETAFYITAAGIGVVSAGILFNTIMQFTKNITENRQSLSEDEIRFINDNESISINDEDVTFQQPVTSFPDAISITTEELINAQYGEKCCPPCTIL